MAQVRIVTDSAADLPHDSARALGISVVPLAVSFGSSSYLDGVDITPDEFYRLLASDPNFPRTSQPAVGLFEQTYTTLRDEGAEIISLHLSSGLSGTLQAATIAAGNVPGATIHLVDSLTASMGEGVMVLEAARMAAAGRDAATILAYVERMKSRVHVGIMLDTLAYVQRGGRIGRAASMIGTLLSVKPILGVEDGIVVPRQRVRTTGKALQELANETRNLRPLKELYVLHSNAKHLADALLPLLRPFAPGEIPVQLIGPVVGAHVGAGAVGIVSLRREEPDAH